MEFGLVQGRKGDQALQVRLLEPVQSVAKAVSRSHRKKPADMVTIIEDLYGLLEGIEGAYRAGRHPDAEDREADRQGAPRAGRRARALSPASTGRLRCCPAGRAGSS